MATLGAAQSLAVCPGIRLAANHVDFGVDVPPGTAREPLGLPEVHHLEAAAAGRDHDAGARLGGDNVAGSKRQVLLDGQRSGGDSVRLARAMGDALRPEQVRRGELGIGLPGEADSTVEFALATRERVEGSRSVGACRGAGGLMHRQVALRVEPP